jgi:hypothetical protein
VKQKIQSKRCRKMFWERGRYYSKLGDIDIIKISSLPLHENSEGSGDPNIHDLCPSPRIEGKYKIASVLLMAT